MIREASAIFVRDFRKFLSNPFAILMTLFMPIMYLVIFGNAMGGAITDIPIAAVQESPYVDLTDLYSSSVSFLQEYHQEDNPPVFLVTRYPDERSAKLALSEGKIYGVIIFPSMIDQKKTVRLYLDSSEYMIPGLITSGLNAALAKSGVKTEEYITNIYGKIEYIQFFGVGVIVMAIFMTTMMGGGIALIRDREMGIHEGYLVTRVKRSSIILGIIGSGTVRAFLAGVIIFIADLLITGITIQSGENLLMVLLILSITSLGVTSLVVALSSRFANQQEYASSVAFINLILFMTSGAFYPVIGMPDWLKWITVINPEYYTVHALRSIILRGQGIDIIGLDLVALCIFSGITILLGITTFRRTLE